MEAGAMTPAFVHSWEGAGTVGNGRAQLGTGRGQRQRFDLHARPPTVVLVVLGLVIVLLVVLDVVPPLPNCALYTCSAVSLILAVKVEAMRPPPTDSQGSSTVPSRLAELHAPPLKAVTYRRLWSSVVGSMGR